MWYKLLLITEPIIQHDVKQKFVYYSIRGRKKKWKVEND